MPYAPRPDKKVRSLFYKIMKTPKNQRQENDKWPSERRIESWERDSLNSQ